VQIPVPHLHTPNRNKIRNSNPPPPFLPPSPLTVRWRLPVLPGLSTLAFDKSVSFAPTFTPQTPNNNLQQAKRTPHVRRWLPTQMVTPYLYNQSSLLHSQPVFPTIHQFKTSGPCALKSPLVQCNSPSPPQCEPRIICKLSTCLLCSMARESNSKPSFSEFFFHLVRKPKPLIIFCGRYHVSFLEARAPLAVVFDSTVR
jgi:hypothetical protein